MSNGFTVNSLATQYADRQLAYQQNIPEARRDLMRKRMEYDFKVTGFNAATAATIVTLALAILSNSFLVLAACAVIHNIRKSFMRAVEQTAILPAGPAQPINPELLHRIANLNPTQRRNEIAAYLEINEDNWQMIQYQLFDFKGWMNWTPALPVLVNDQPAAAAGELANVND